MILPFPDFQEDLKKNPRSLLGIDLGTKTIGLSFCASGTSLATPLKTLKRITLKKDFHALKTLQKDFPFEGAIIGLPLNMDGTEGPRAQASRQFGLYFGQTFSIPVCFWDERLTTHEAHEHLMKARARPHKKDQYIDQYAAQIILQTFLDTL